jgi:hypothetical protein
MVHVVPQPSAFEKGDAPAVAVMVSFTAPFGKTCEAERNVSRGVAVHTEQLAHDGFGPLDRRSTAGYPRGGQPAPPENS